MKVLFLTNEYPPHIYGGAGVHVGYLSRELAKTMPVEVRCFGDQRIEAFRAHGLQHRLDVTGRGTDVAAREGGRGLVGGFAVRGHVRFLVDPRHAREGGHPVFRGVGD